MFVFYAEATGAIQLTVNGVSYPDRLPEPGLAVTEASLPEGQSLTDWRVLEGELVHAPQPPTGADINTERDRRLHSTFAFRGVEYDCDPVSLARITGAATLAGFAIGAGAPEGFFRWHGGDADFMWIAHDNSLTVMDAPTCFAFGQTAATNQSAHLFAADVLKRQSPIPADFANDRRWS